MNIPCDVFRADNMSGISVKVHWELQFDDAGIVDQKTELLSYRIVRQILMCTRDALYGGRTEAMRLHYKAQENKTIQYADVMNLYT